MPLPIQLVNDKNYSEDKMIGSSGIDYSFLLNASPMPQASAKRIVEASNEDAKNLLDAWIGSEKTDKGDYTLKTSSLSDMDISKLKHRGFIDGDKTSMKFTSKGKAVITTMTLGENNAFLKNKKEVSYKEILASMDKSKKNGYRIPKYAADNSNTLTLSGEKQD